MTPTKILFCTDFSENSIPASQQAGEYADTFGAKLIILHVVESWAGFSGNPQDILEIVNKIEESAKDQLETLATNIRKNDGKVETRCAIGVPADEIVQLGSKEIWEFNNIGGGMMHMMNLPHPIHLHGKQFRIIERSGVMHEGYVDEGWKDTALLMPGERIRILVDFDDYPGLFLYHCHNLEHEDMGMMRNYFVRG